MQHATEQAELAAEFRKKKYWQTRGELDKKPESETISDADAGSMSGKEQRDNADEIATPADEEVDPAYLEDILSDVRPKTRRVMQTMGKTGNICEGSPQVSKTFVTYKRRSRPRKQLLHGLTSQSNSCGNFARTRYGLWRAA